MKKDIINSILSYIFLFFIFSIIGYIWEVGLKLVQTGNLINTGSMHGPWLPIFGSGGILILFFLKKSKKKPVLVFILSLLICTTMKYLASYILELTTGLRWWDYSNYLININGRICLEGAVVFGIAGCIVLYVAEPFFSKGFNLVSKKAQITICIFLIILFTGDAIYSHYHPNMGEGITYNQTKT